MLHLNSRIDLYVAIGGNSVLQNIYLTNLMSSVPGQEVNVFLEHPEDVKTLLYTDGKNPIEPGFDFFVKYRQSLRKDLYPETGGLVGSHGDKWYAGKQMLLFL